MEQLNDSSLVLTCMLGSREGRGLIVALKGEN